MYNVKRKTTGLEGEKFCKKPKIIVVCDMKSQLPLAIYLYGTKISNSGTTISKARGFKTSTSSMLNISTELRMSMLICKRKQ